MRERQLVWVFALAGAVLAGAACTGSTEPSPFLRVTMGPSPSPFILGKCSTWQLSAAVADEAGLLVTPDSVRWTSGNSAVATVTQSGFMTVRSGPAVVTITAAAFKGTLAGIGLVTFSTGGGPPETCPP